MCECVSDERECVCASTLCVQGLWVGSISQEQYDHGEVALPRGPVDGCGVELTTTDIWVGPFLHNTMTVIVLWCRLL